jgi:hypothetical protein
MTLARHWLLNARTGPVRVVTASAATADERLVAHPKHSAHRILGILAAAGELQSLAAVLGEGSTPALERRLRAAIDDGTLLFVPGWTWSRPRSPPADRPISPRLPPPEEQRARPARKAVFELIIVDAQTGHPLSGVPLEIDTPDGSTRRLDTDQEGTARIGDLEPGTCTVRSVIDEARVQSSFVAAPGSAPPARRGVAATGPAFLVDVARHRTASGQTPASIAREWGVPWEDIALFNWGTSDADELDMRYRKTLGCKQTAPDGTLAFDDGDDPGLILIPRPWEASLAVGTVHRLSVSPLRTVFLSLRNEAGLALPGARYEARFADGSSRAGHLGRAGVARLEGVPEGAFSVSYPDELDLQAKSMAASVRRAFGEQATGPLFTLLMQDAELIGRATAAYDQCFNDLTGRGLVADIDQVVTDPEARRPLLALCAMAQLAVEGSASVSIETFSGAAVDPTTPSIDQRVGR